MDQVKKKQAIKIVINLLCITNYLYAKRKAGKKYIKISKIIGEPLKFLFSSMFISIYYFYNQENLFFKK